MKSLFGRIIFRISKLILHKFGFNIKLGDYQAQYPELNKVELDFLKSVLAASITMTSFESLTTLALACKYIVKNKISGDFVEAGVWRGGSSIVAKKFLTGERSYYLFDTYTGMTEPTIHDSRVGASSNTSTVEHWKNQSKSTHNEWAFASLEEVKKNFRSFNVLDSSINFIKGNVLETLLGSNLPKKISLLRLDTDFYDSTLIELQVLWPRLVSGGILILDDYGHWDGARRAVDEYFEKETDVLMVPIAGGGGRIVIKK